MPLAQSFENLVALQRWENLIIGWMDIDSLGLHSCMTFLILNSWYRRWGARENSSGMEFLNFLCGVCLDQREVFLNFSWKRMQVGAGRSPNLNTRVVRLQECQKPLLLSLLYDQGWSITGAWTSPRGAAWRSSDIPKLSTTEYLPHFRGAIILNIGCFRKSWYLEINNRCMKIWKGKNWIGGHHHIWKLMFKHPETYGMTITP